MITQAQIHAEAVKREIAEGRMIPTESISMKTVNLDNFKLDHKGGITNVAELVELKEQIDNTLAGISGAIRFLIEYHTNSPRRVWDELEKGEYGYTVGLNLEPLMPGESESEEIYPGYRISNNYALAKKLIEKFEEQGGNTTGFEDISFRDTAMWNITSKSRAKKFVSFINKVYINPIVKEIMDTYNIKKVIFNDTGIDFEYNDITI